MQKHAGGDDAGDLAERSQRKLLTQLASAPFSPKVSLKVKSGGFGSEALIHENRGSLSELYDIESEVLGEGNYSIVKRCTKKQTSQSYALKSISGKCMRRPDQFDKEVEIMRLMHHPNIVRMIESFREGGDLHIVLELCEGGNLFDAIVDRGPLQQRPAAMIICQVLRAASYLHSHHIHHRDFKAENLLLAEDTPPESTTIKLCDFGIARILMPGEFAETKVGTPYYIAPEIQAGKYTQAADSWAVGVILYMLLGGCPPFVGNNTQEVLDNVRAANVNVKWLGRAVPDDAKELLLALLQREPQQRITPSDALKHRWIERTLQDVEFAAKRGSAIRQSVKDGNFGGYSSNIGIGLKNFSQAAPIQKVVMHAIASHLSREALADLEHAFIQMDVNGDGSLNIAEFVEGLKRAGVTVQMDDISKMFNGIDSDGNGRIDYAEFCAAMMDSSRIAQEGACFKAFDVFDLNGSGTIEREELRSMLEANGIQSAEIDKLFKNINGDDSICFEDFMRAMGRLDKSGAAFTDLENLIASAKSLARQAGRNSSRKTTSSTSTPRSARRKSSDSPRSPRDSSRKKTLDSSPRSSRNPTRKKTTDDGSPRSISSARRKTTDDVSPRSISSARDPSRRKTTDVSQTTSKSDAAESRSPKGATAQSPRQSGRRSTRKSTSKRGDTS